MNLMEEIALRIKQIMQEKNVSEKQLIENVCCTKADIKNILHAKNDDIKTMHLVYICFALDISLKDFFDNEIFIK